MLLLYSFALCTIGASVGCVCLNKTSVHSVFLCDISSNVLNLGSSLIVPNDRSKQTLSLLLPHKPLFSVDLTCISSQYIKKRIEVICHTK